MKLTAKFGITATMLLLTACTTGPRKVSMAEVTASENQIITTARSQPAPLQDEKPYTQPANKIEPCKLLTSKDQLERRNFRAYWDGDCKDGYAYGLGRDIALSDTHHVEEITIYNGDGDSNGQPWRLIDYVHNRGAYGVRGAIYPATAGYDEYISNNSTNFFIEYSVGATDSKGDRRYISVSPFSPVKVTVNQSHGKPDYVLMDYSALPGTSDQAQTVLFAADPATRKPLGFRIVRFYNGGIEHQKLDSDGQSVAELVQLPQEYIAQLLEKIDETQSAVKKASADVAKAEQMEREYLHMACVADYSIKGVPTKDMEIARQICTWRDQWIEPYAKAEAKFKLEMEQRRQEVAQAEQQRAYIAAQHAAAQTATNQAGWASLANQLQQYNQQQKNQIDQMNQQLQYNKNQQNKTTICQTFGNQTICQ